MPEVPEAAVKLKKKLKKKPTLNERIANERRLERLKLAKELEAELYAPAMIPRHLFALVSRWETRPE
jgi:hypothetical protein